MIFNFDTIDELPKRIRQWRAIHGMTLKEASGQMGISLPFLHNLETGVAYPSFETLQKIANVYNRQIVIAIKPKSE
jgi:transcriptional regulator with XRE-family HTH domain